MSKILLIFYGVILVITGRYDYQKCKVPAYILLIWGMGLLALRLLIQENIVWSGLIPGIVSIIISKLIPKEIGLADGIIIMYAGLVFGIMDIVCMLIFTLFMISIGGIIYIKVCNKSIKTKIPFIPFWGIGTFAYELFQYIECI